MPIADRLSPALRRLGPALVLALRHGGAVQAWAAGPHVLSPDVPAHWDPPAGPGADAGPDAEALELLIVCETDRPPFERWRLFSAVLDLFPGCDVTVHTPEEMRALAPDAPARRTAAHGIELLSVLRTAG